MEQELNIKCEEFSPMWLFAKLQTENTEAGQILRIIDFAEHHQGIGQSQMKAEPETLKVMTTEQIFGKSKVSEACIEIMNSPTGFTVEMVTFLIQSGFSFNVDNLKQGGYEVHIEEDTILKIKMDFVSLSIDNKRVYTSVGGKVDPLRIRSILMHKS